MHNSITLYQIEAFILDEIQGEQKEKIIEAINKDEITKGIYLFEKRKYDTERYLSDEMVIGERLEFEELLTKSQSLRVHYVLSKKINESLKIEVLQNQLEKIHEEQFGSNSYNEVYSPEKERGLANRPTVPEKDAPVKKLKPGITRLGKWATAASVALLILGSSATVYFSNRDSLENRLYAKYYEPQKKDRSFLFNSALLFEARNKYYSKDYNTALLLLDNLPNSLTVEGEKFLYKGLTLMGLERYEEAIVCFDKLNNHADYKFIHPYSQWYSGMCYLKMGKKAKAAEYFRKLIQDNRYNYKKAKKILKKIN